ncbi:hypothetical protein Back11_00590 [Paenibacillus baekrokdamisoli]|uniref:Uncharacterized protein n=1 Tax=Paenibacillus baekrokdamisoli TaxID=1712516 RepID=A0A3G9J5U1_9BACL|nr:histidine kinase [Paenibacillus baekrokdamisoli]MBB3069314.1 two-component system sensor histidine kinase YesM [Paenibacillus baekrokdamisoli]BBH18714.1 hypothetical protein Back11_00590 [Paenibacillus baekrokdamisoli]
MGVFIQSRRSSIFTKIVVTFLGLLTPLFAMIFFMNESGSSMVKEEILKSMDAKVEWYVNFIEADFDRVLKLIQANVNDDNLLKLSTSSMIMTPVERTFAINALKSKLDLIKTSSSFVQNVSAFIPELNRTVTSNDNSIRSFDEEQYKALSVTTNRYESPYLMWNKRLFISVPYPDPAVSGGHKPIFLLTVEVSEPALRSTLKQFTTNGEYAVFSGNKLLWSIEGGEGELRVNELVNGLRASKIKLKRQSIELSGAQYLVVSKSSERLDTTLSVLMPEKQIFGSLERYRWWLLFLMLASGCIVIFFAFSLYRIILKPLRTLIRSFNRVEQGNLKLVVKYPLKDEFGFLYERFNVMVKELDVLVHEVYEHKYRSQLAELRQLQSQINPHFLYNSFFILHRMANLKDNDSIIRFTKYLGDYFQFITRDGLYEVPLSLEVKHARTYIDIQGFRFAGRIRTEFGELPEQLMNTIVPRMILQPIIENVYNHGLDNKVRDGLLKVNFLQTMDELIISIEDNGDEMNESKLQSLRLLLLTPEQAVESTGLINVHRRLQIKYGDMWGLRLSIGKGGGLRVELKLPIRKELNEDASLVDSG